MSRPTPKPGEVYQHYIWGPVVIYGISTYKPLEPLDAEIYLAAASWETKSVKVFLGFDSELHHHDQSVEAELVVYHGRIFYCAPIDYFLEVLGQKSTHYYRHELALNELQAQQVYGLIDRYNRATETNEACR